MSTTASGQLRARSQHRRGGAESLIDKVAGPKARFVVFALFLVVVFAMGGGSRGDILSLVVLRPASILFAAYGLSLATWADLRRVAVPFWLLVTLIAIVAIQLIPLPPSVWSALPSRTIFMQTAEILEMKQPWRPLAISPATTWNSLFSLGVPLAALVLFAIQGSDYRRRVWVALALLGIASAVWGMLQIVGSNGGVFYLYRITNADSPVGLFSNRNHQALFLAAMLLAAAWIFRSIDPEERKSGALAFLSAVCFALLLPMNLLAGSRAGLALMMIALLCSLYFLHNAPMLPARIRIGRRLQLSKKALVLLVAAAILALAGLLILLSQSLAFDRLIQSGSIEEIRFIALPTIIDLAKEHGLWGAGFGSFDPLFKMYEPDVLLRQRYLNQAHNDWLQVVIEGGVPVLVVLFAFIAWFLARLVAVWRMTASAGRDLRLMAAGILVLFGLASVVDYPARVPIMMVLMAVAAATLAMPSRANLQSS